MQIGECSKDNAELNEFTEIDQIVLETILQGHVQRDNVFQMDATNMRGRLRVVSSC